jgi:hypothetical protein
MMEYPLTVKQEAAHVANMASPGGLSYAISDAQIAAQAAWNKPEAAVRNAPRSTPEAERQAAGAVGDLQ